MRATGLSVFGVLFAGSMFSAISSAASFAAASFAAATVAATPVRKHGPSAINAVGMLAKGRDTTVAIDLDRRTPCLLTVLHAPDRLILTMPHTYLRHPGQVPAASGFVKRIRLEPGADDGWQIVLELSQPVRPSRSSQTLHDHGYRWLIALRARQDTVAPDIAASGIAASGTAARGGAKTTTGTRFPVRPVTVAHARPAARDLIIAVDAGHGGDDPGAIGPNGTREKDIVLSIAKALAAKIDAEPGMRAVLTRNGDYFVALRDRMRRARAQQADLFVSVHADSIRDRSIDGSSVYILSARGASDEASRWLAERENAADLIGGVSLEDKDDVLASVLLDVSQSASLQASHAAAQRVLHELTRAGEVRKHEVQEARFMVLKSPDIPSMLVETAYISNAQEEQRLRTFAQQARLAAAIHGGVHDYFYANPPPGSRIGQLAIARSSGATARSSGAGGAN